MGVTAATPNEIFVGAGDVWANGLSVGATQDSNTFRVIQAKFAPLFNGVRGPLAGVDYIQRETGQLEVTLPQISASKLALSVPNSTSVTGDDTALTDLNGAVIAGATTITVTAATDITVGMILRIGTGQTMELVEVLSIATLVLTLTAPLIYAHADSEAVAAVADVSIGAGASRRIGSASYITVELRVPGIDGAEVRFGLRKAIATTDATFEGKDDGTLAPRITFEARWDPAAPTVSPWYIRVVPPVTP